MRRVRCRVKAADNEPRAWTDWLSKTQYNPCSSSRVQEKSAKLPRFGQRIFSVNSRICSRLASGRMSMPSERNQADMAGSCSNSGSARYARSLIAHTRAATVIQGVIWIPGGIRLGRAKNSNTRLARTASSGSTRLEERISSMLLFQCRFYSKKNTSCV